MSKKIPILVLCSLFHVQAFADLTPLELAKVSKSVYLYRKIPDQSFNQILKDLELSFFDGFSEIKPIAPVDAPNRLAQEKADLHGIQALTLVDSERRVIIVSFRGTETPVTGNAWIDAGIALAPIAIGDYRPIEDHLDRFAKYYKFDAAHTYSKALKLGPTLLNSVATTLEVSSKTHPSREAARELQAAAEVVKNYSKLNETVSSLTGDIADEVLIHYRIKPHQLIQYTENSVKNAEAYSWKTLKLHHETLLKEYYLDSSVDDEPAEGGVVDYAGTIFYYLNKGFSAATGSRYCPVRGYQLYITGHSLGGFLAQIVGAKVLNYCKRHDGSIRVVTFNSPRAEDFIRHHEDEGYEIPRPAYHRFIKHYYRPSNIVATYGNNAGGELIPLHDYHDGPTFGLQVKALRNKKESGVIRKILGGVSNLIWGRKSTGEINKEIHFELRGSGGASQDNHGIDQLIKDYREVQKFDENDFSLLEHSNKNLPWQR